MVRDLPWLEQLLGWLEAGLAAGRSERLGLRSSGLKLLRFPDAPEPGYTTWCTFEHSDRRWPGPGVEVGYELVVAAKGPVDGLTILRRAVDTLRAVDRPPVVGTAVLDLLVGVEGLPPALRHAVFVPPWWDDRLEPLVHGTRRVEAVHVVPASEEEVDRLRRDGFEALASRWERTLTPLLDPGRPTVA